MCIQVIQAGTCNMTKNFVADIFIKWLYDYEGLKDMNEAKTRGNLE